MAEKGCLFTIACIMGLAIMSRVNWFFPGTIIGPFSGIVSTIAIGWLFTRDDPKSNK